MKLEKGGKGEADFTLKFQLKYIFSFLLVVSEYKLLFNQFHNTSCSFFPIANEVDNKSLMFSRSSDDVILLSRRISIYNQNFAHMKENNFFHIQNLFI